MKRTARQKKFDDDARLLRAWQKYHGEQLQEVLTGPHAVIATQIVEFLKTMTPASANALLELMRGHVWADVDAQTKFTLLHEINAAIMRVREANGKPPIDDPLPGERRSVFQVIKQMLFA